jgi:hypothetical protein
MRIVNHGGRVIGTVLPISPFMLEVLERSGLAPLIHCCYFEVERGLIASFIEKWHEKTSSFHLPIGEMTVTLDDVATITHLPVYGEIFQFVKMRRVDARVH